MDDKMNNGIDVEKFVESIGATAEVMSILRGALISNGFNEQESLYLCGEVIKVMFSGGNKK